MTRKSFYSIWSKASLKACRTRSRVKAAAAMALLFAAAGSATAADVPEWLEAARHVQLGDFGKGSPAVVIESRVVFSIDAAGRFTESERAALLILNRRAAERWLAVAGAENSEESVVSLQAWSISPSGKVEKTNKNDVVTRAGYAEFILYSDSRIKSVAIPGVQDGSIVGYEMVRQGKPVIRSERFALERDIPVWLSEVQVNVPAGSLRYFVNLPDRVQAVPQMNATGAPTTATFRAERRPPIVEETNMPPYWSVRAAVFVNYDPAGMQAVAEWADVGRAEYPMYAEAIQITPDIAAEAERLTRSAADPLLKVRALNDFVSRRIRYVAIFLGDGGFRPHSADQVFSNRFGDCKDKAILLISMLRHIGIEAHPAFIGTRGVIEASPETPSTTSFNHAIVAMPVSEPQRQMVSGWPAYDEEKHILWIDPTSDRTPLGELPAMDQGVHALIVTGEGSQLLRTPESSAMHNSQRYKATLRLQANGEGEAQVRVEYTGNNNAVRHSHYRGRSESEIRQALEQRLARYVTQPVLSESEIEGVEENHWNVVETISFRGNFTAASTSSGWFFQPLFLSGMDSWEVSAKPRVHTLDLGLPYSTAGEYKIELPPGFELDRLPDPVTIETKFGSVRLEYTLTDGVLTTVHEVSYRVSRIAPDQYPAFRNFINQASRLERQRLRIRPIQ